MGKYGRVDWIRDGNEEYVKKGIEMTNEEQVRIVDYVCGRSGISKCNNENEPRLDKGVNA